MRIEERLIRRAPEDIVYIGQLVESCLMSEMGAILQALTNGKMTEEALRSRRGLNGNTPADRTLGRIEAFAELMLDLEQFVEEKDKALRPIEENKAEEQQEGASEPQA